MSEANDALIGAKSAGTTTSLVIVICGTSSSDFLALGTVDINMSLREVPTSIADDEAIFCCDEDCFSACGRIAMTDGVGDFLLKIFSKTICIFLPMVKRPLPIRDKNPFGSPTTSAHS